MIINRKNKMLELRQKGFSYQSISIIFGLSRQRVHQITSDYTKNLTGLEINGWYDKIRSLILRRDGFKCQKCENNNRKKLVIHHIDKKDTNNNLNNLVCLCNNCHLYFHRPKINRDIKNKFIINKIK